jgi:membrane protein insertase Oxa1/YidC/SpoIIIJ
MPQLYWAIKELWIFVQGTIFFLPSPPKKLKHAIPRPVKVNVDHSFRLLVSARPNANKKKPNIILGKEKCSKSLWNITTHIV